MLNSILIVVFNYSNTLCNKDIIKDIYESHFKKIIFYSDLPVINDDEVNFIDIERGCYVHKIFNHFYMNYNTLINDSDGIFYTMDDNIFQLSDEISGDVLIPTIIYFVSDKINSNTKVSELTYLEHYFIGSVGNDLYLTNKDYEYYFYQFKRFLGITSRSIDKSKEFLNKWNLKIIK
jgi:hypothetical protein